MPNNNLIDQGQLRISAVSAKNSIPISNATIEISYTGESDQVLETLQTDASGNSPTIDLKAPPIEYSLNPGDNQPYYWSKSDKECYIQEIHNVFNKFRKEYNK